MKKDSPDFDQRKQNVEQQINVAGEATVSSSKNNVVVGQGATSNVIITGDGNQINLDDLLQTSMPAQGKLDKSQVLKEYRKYLCRIYANLPLNRMVISQTSGQLAQYKPFQISVQLGYIRLAITPPSQYAKETFLLKKTTGTIGRYIRKKQMLLRAPYKLGESNTTTTYADEVVDSCTSLLLVGEAGSGKSTFLRYLTWFCAGRKDRLPLLVSLQTVDAAMSQGQGFLEAVLDVLVSDVVGAQREQLRTALYEEISDQRVYWLFDGWDEVRTHTRLMEEAISRIVADGQPLIMTSRPQMSTIATNFELICSLLPIQMDDVQKFASIWFKILSEVLKVSTEEQLSWYEARLSWFMSQLHNSPNLREIVQTPLGLTFLIALASDERQPELVDSNKNVYERYVERLCLVREEARQGPDSLLPGIEDPYEVREVLKWGQRQLALILHESYGREGKPAVFKRVSEALASSLSQETGIARLYARSRARRILSFWEQAGLLIRYEIAGNDWFVFRHLMFQEYGAALALIDTYKDDLIGLWEKLECHLGDDYWCGVVPIILLNADMHEASFLVTRLVEASNKGLNFYQPLFVAVECLCAGVEVEESEFHRVIDALVYLIRFGTHTDIRSADAFDVLELFRYLPRNDYSAARLVDIVGDRSLTLSLRSHAKQILVRQGRISDLLDLVTDKQETDERRLTVAEALGYSLPRRTIREEFLDIAHHPDTGHDSRIKAIELLAQAELKEETLQTCMSSIMNPETEQQHVDDIVNLLRNWGLIEEAGNRLMDILSQEAETVPTWGIIQILCQLKSVEHLLEFAEFNDLDEQMYLPIARRLLKSGRFHDSASALVRVAISSRSEERAKEFAIRSLIQTRREDELLIVANAKIPPHLRLLAIQGVLELGILNTDNREQISKVLHLLMYDQSADCIKRIQIAQTLGEIGLVYAREVARFLLSYVSNESETEHVRIQAIEALGRLGRRVNYVSVLRVLADLANDDSVPPKIRSSASEAWKAIHIRPPSAHEASYQK